MGVKDNAPAIPGKRIIPELSPIYPVMKHERADIENSPKAGGFFYDRARGIQIWISPAMFFLSLKSLWRVKL